LNTADISTPVSLARLTTPAQPTISTQGVTNSIGGAQQFGEITIQNRNATGNIFVGSPTMTAATGIELAPGAMWKFGNALSKVILDQVWVDTDTSGNKVTFLAI
jgi:hypothetical protein